MSHCYRCASTLKKGSLRCDCGAWNHEVPKELAKGILLSDVKDEDLPRIHTGPWDHMWGKNWKTEEVGLVKGSATILGGSPGAGKSTLLLMMAAGAIHTTGLETWYIASEEALAPIKDRFNRLSLDGQEKVRMFPVMGGYEGIPEPDKRVGFAILDSLNGIAGQDLRATSELAVMSKIFAMKANCPIISISHITKRGDVAGLMTLQHAVDTIMTFFPTEENLGEESPRELVVEKNRNGAAYLKMTMLMTEKGLIPVTEE